MQLSNLQASTCQCLQYVASHHHPWPRQSFLAVLGNPGIHLGPSRKSVTNIWHHLFKFMIDILHTPGGTTSRCFLSSQNVCLVWTYSINTEKPENVIPRIVIMVMDTRIISYLHKSIFQFNTWNNSAVITTGVSYDFTHMQENTFMKKGKVKCDI